jgi:hypothetical protein
MRHPFEVFGLAFSPNGRWIFTSTKGERVDGIPSRYATVEGWDSSTGEWLAQLAWFPQEVYQVDVNAEGTHLIVAGAIGEIALLPLDAIDRPVDPSAAPRMQAEAELFSGQRIREKGGSTGQTAHNLTTEDWVARWQAWAGKSPIRYRPGP